eukprot:1362633-Amorphochlora_amoeboformis.AAC.2
MWVSKEEGYAEEACWPTSTSFIPPPEGPADTCTFQAPFSVSDHCRWGCNPDESLKSLQGSPEWRIECLDKPKDHDCSSGDKTRRHGEG